MKIKKNMRIVLVSIACLLLLSVSAFANERSISCANCVSGRYLTITRNEEDVLVLPCSHGFGTKQDYFVTELRNTYYECNECHYGYLVSSVQGAQNLYCMA